MNMIGWSGCLNVPIGHLQPFQVLVLRERRALHGVGLAESAGEGEKRGGSVAGVTVEGEGTLVRFCDEAC